MLSSRYDHDDNIHHYLQIHSIAGDFHISADKIDSRWSGLSFQHSYFEVTDGQKKQTGDVRYDRPELNCSDLLQSYSRCWSDFRRRHYSDSIQATNRAAFISEMSWLTAHQRNRHKAPLHKGRKLKRDRGGDLSSNI